MKKKGFTLVELLAVVAIMAVIAIIAIPNVVGIFNESVDKFFKQQEKYAIESANMFVKEYCDKVNSSISCPYYYATNDPGTKYLCLKDLEAAGLLEEMKYKGNTCEGMIMYDSSGKGSAYIYCGRNGSNYAYKSTNATSVSIKSNCKK